MPFFLGGGGDDSSRTASLENDNGGCDVGPSPELCFTVSDKQPSQRR